MYQLSIHSQIFTDPLAQNLNQVTYFAYLSCREHSNKVKMKSKIIRITHLMKIGFLVLQLQIFCTVWFYGKKTKHTYRKWHSMANILADSRKMERKRFRPKFNVSSTFKQIDCYIFITQVLLKFKELREKRKINELQTICLMVSQFLQCKQAGTQCVIFLIMPA